MRDLDHLVSQASLQPASWCRVEILTHDINVHVPHHVSSNIPWYNLRKATDSLRQNWGQVCSSPSNVLSIA